MKEGSFITSFIDGINVNIRSIVKRSVVLCGDFFLLFNTISRYFRSDSSISHLFEELDIVMFLLRRFQLWIQWLTKGTKNIFPTSLIEHVALNAIFAGHLFVRGPTSRDQKDMKRCQTPNWNGQKAE